MNALIEQCRDLTAAGQTFDSVWKNVLRRHPLVEGRIIVPAAGRCVLVPLTNGHTLELDERAREWHIRGQLPGYAGRQS